MTISIRNLICVLTAGFMASAMAGEVPVKDTGPLEAEARKLATELNSEASELEKSAIASGTKLTEEMKAYIDITRKEAMWAGKCAEAWSKNQKRLAENYAEKARELCGKRGPMAEKLYASDKQKPAEKVEKSEKAEKSGELAEIERQQAALEAKKQQLLKNGKAD